MSPTNDRVRVHDGAQRGLPARAGGVSGDPLHVDCGGCAVRGRACSDCVISVLLGIPADVADRQRVDEALEATSDSPLPFELDPVERAALDALAGSGLLPPLRLVHNALADQAPVGKAPNRFGRDHSVT